MDLEINEYEEEEIEELDSEEIFNDKKPEVILGNSNSLLWACGRNENYELALKEHPIIVNPSGVTIPKQKRIVSVSVAREHSGFLTVDGLIYMCGSGLHGKLGIKNLNYTNVKTPKLLKFT